MHLGLTHYMKGEFYQALEMYKNILQLNSEKRGFDVDHVGIEPRPLNHLGEVYIALGDYEQALNVLEKSLQLQQVNFRKAEPLTNIAEVYYHQGKLVEAMTTCQESLALSRTYGGRIQAGKTLHLMAKIRFQEKQYNEALEDITEAVAIFRTTGSRHLSEAEDTFRQIKFYSEKTKTDATPRN